MAKKQSRKSKMGVIVAVLLLAVGFAAVTTTLYINGTIKIVPDTEDFNKNVFFSEAQLDYSLKTASNVAKLTLANPGAASDVTGGTAPSTLTIAKDGKTISFTTANLDTINETVTLTYKVSNKSQYKAKLDKIVCKLYDSAITYDADGAIANTDVSSDDHLQITVSDNTETLTEVTGVSAANTVEVKMVKSYVGESETTTSADESKTLYVGCTINATAQEASATTAAAGA